MILLFILLPVKPKNTQLSWRRLRGIQNKGLQGRQRREDVIHSTPGLIGKAAIENLETPIDTFNLFIDDEMLLHNVESTNIKIADYICITEKDTSKVSNVQEIDLIELRAYIGLMLYRGFA